MTRQQGSDPHLYKLRASSTAAHRLWHGCSCRFAHQHQAEPPRKYLRMCSAPLRAPLRGRLAPG